MTESPALTAFASVSLDQIAESLRAAGYRAQTAEADGRPVIRSAAQGLGFVVCPGNAADNGRYVDYSFNCLLRAEGDLQMTAIEAWNRSKRFSRLYRDRELLVLSMDVLVAGGVSAASLVAQCELWDRLLHDLIAYLKTSQMVVASASAQPESEPATVE